MAELSNNKGAGGRLIDPVTHDPLNGSSPDYIGTIKIGNVRYNPGSLRALIGAADLGIDIEAADKEEWVISAVMELMGLDNAIQDLRALQGAGDDNATELLAERPLWMGFQGSEPDGFLGALALHPREAGDLWRRRQKLRDPVTGLGFTKKEAGKIYDHLSLDMSPAKGLRSLPAMPLSISGGTRKRRRRRRKKRGKGGLTKGRPRRRRRKRSRKKNRRGRTKEQMPSDAIVFGNELGEIIYWEEFDPKTGKTIRILSPQEVKKDKPHVFKYGTDAYGALDFSTCRCVECDKKRVEDLVELMNWGESNGENSNEENSPPAAAARPPSPVDFYTARGPRTNAEAGGMAAALRGNRTPSPGLAWFSSSNDELPRKKQTKSARKTSGGRRRKKGGQTRRLIKDAAGKINLAKPAHKIDIIHSKIPIRPAKPTQETDSYWTKWGTQRKERTKGLFKMYGRPRPPTAKSGGRRKRRRRRIGNDKRQLKRLQTQYLRFRIAMGDKRFKKTKGLVKCTRISKGKRTAKIYHRRKCRKNERRI